MVAMELRQANKEAWTGRLDGLHRFISQVFDLALVLGKGMGSSRMLEISYLITEGVKIKVN